MSNIPNIAEKKDLECSLVHLIDENSCIGNSADIINFNVTSLSAALYEIEQKAGDYNRVYSLFAAYSAIWLAASSNIFAYGDFWVNATTTVENSSANWVREFNIIYPEILYLDDWYAYRTWTDQSLSAVAQSTSNSYTDYVIPDWLEEHFPPLRYAPNQTVVVLIHLYHHQPVDFIFNKNYLEQCLAEGGVAVNCTECNSPYYACNNGNGYDNCVKTLEENTAVYKCQGTGSTNLQLYFQDTSADTSVGRIIRIKYKLSLDRTSWEPIF
jgi:hypothetical protein